MNQFRFRLQRVLDWQRERCELIENDISRLCGEVERIQSQMAAARAALVAAEEQVLTTKQLEGALLRGLASYRLRLQKLGGTLDAERRACQIRLTEKRTQWVEARKRYRIMERLKHRKEQEHSYLLERELDKLAAEAYAARWHTEHDSITA